MLETILTGILIIGGTIALSVGGLWLVHRSVPYEIRCRYNDVAGFIYAAVGVIYAILLAYVVIVVWQQFDATGSTVELEAVATANIFHGVDEFPEPARSNVRDMVRDYVERTVNDDWPAMADGGADEQAGKLAHSLRDVIHQLPADDAHEQVMFDHVLYQYEQVLTQRQLRLFQAGESLHPLLWAMLIIGAALTIGFTYFFGVDSALVHVLMIVGLAFVIGGMLFMIQQVDHPFGGQVSVSPEAFRTVLQTFTAD